MIAVAVKDFVPEPMSKMLSSVMGIRRFTSAYP